jgi:hypothetical protein
MQYVVCIIISVLCKTVLAAIGYSVDRYYVANLNFMHFFGALSYCNSRTWLVSTYLEGKKESCTSMQDRFNILHAYVCRHSIRV